MHVYFLAWDKLNGVPKTGDAGNISMRVLLDGAAPAIPTNPITEPDAANAPGWYGLELTAAEIDGDSFGIAGLSSTPDIEVYPWFFIRGKKATAAHVYFLAWDTVNDQPRTGDAANFSMRAFVDGAESTPSGAISEVDAVNCPGIYHIQLSATEMNGDSIVVMGSSSTAWTLVYIVPIVTEYWVEPIDPTLQPDFVTELAENCAARFTTLTYETNVFANHQPDSDSTDPVVFFLGTGGPPGRFDDAWREITVQVLVTSPAVSGYTPGWNMIKNIEDQYHGSHAWHLPSFYVSTGERIQPPYPLGRDEKGRERFSFNFLFKFRRT